MRASSILNTLRSEERDVLVRVGVLVCIDVSTGQIFLAAPPHPTFQRLSPSDLLPCQPEEMCRLIQNGELSAEVRDQLEKATDIAAKPKKKRGRPEVPTTSARNQKIRDYQKDHPKARHRTIAEALNCTIHQVHNALKPSRNRGKKSQQKTLSRRDSRNPQNS